MDEYIKDIKKTDIQIISQEIFVHDPFDRVKNLKVSTGVVYIAMWHVTV